MFLAFQTDTTRLRPIKFHRRTVKVSPINSAIALGSDFRGHHNHRMVVVKRGVPAMGTIRSVPGEATCVLPQATEGHPEGEGNLLDNTVSLYGSATSTTHNARNYPLVLAGGSSLGFKHGAFHKYTEETPLANLFVSVQKRLESPPNNSQIARANSQRSFDRRTLVAHDPALNRKQQ